MQGAKAITDMKELFLSPHYCLAEVSETSLRMMSVMVAATYHMVPSAGGLSRRSDT